MQLLFTLCDVGSFLDVFASDLQPRSMTKICTVIVIANPHTEGVSHWLAVHFRPESSSAYYFDTYGIIPLVPDILTSIRRKFTTWDHTRITLGGLTGDVCGKYCCLFALYMDRATLPNNS